jgi:hypothetical protein
MYSFLIKKMINISFMEFLERNKFFTCNILFFSIKVRALRVYEY